MARRVMLLIAAILEIGLIIFMLENETEFSVPPETMGIGYRGTPHRL